MNSVTHIERFCLLLLTVDNWLVSYKGSTYSKYCFMLITENTDICYQYWVIFQIEYCFYVDYGERRYLWSILSYLSDRILFSCWLQRTQIFVINIELYLRSNTVFMLIIENVDLYYQDWVYFSHIKVSFHVGYRGRRSLLSRLGYFSPIEVYAHVDYRECSICFLFNLINSSL